MRTKRAKKLRTTSRKPGKLRRSQDRFGLAQAFQLQFLKDFGNKRTRKILKSLERVKSPSAKIRELKRLKIIKNPRRPSRLKNPTQAQLGMERISRSEGAAAYARKRAELAEAFGATPKTIKRAKKSAKKALVRVKKSRSALAKLLKKRKKKSATPKSRKEEVMAKKRKKRVAKKSAKKATKKRGKVRAKKATRKSAKRGARKSRKMKVIRLKRKKSVKIVANPMRRRRRRKLGSVRVKRSYRRRRNPILGGKNMLQSWLAHSAGEAGGLLLGGALYGATGSLIRKIPVIGTKLDSALRQVPVVGPSLPTLLAGVVLVKLGERQKIDALRMVGKGLIGATVVGIGVNASQMIPGLKASPVSGVDFTPGLSGVDYTALGMDVDSADFGGGQLGEQAYGILPEGLGGVDFTMGDGADFGEIPEGLGEGQMG